jgi:hypothetical protein
VLIVTERKMLGDSVYQNRVDGHHITYIRVDEKMVATVGLL